MNSYNIVLRWALLLPLATANTYLFSIAIDFLTRFSYVFNVLSVLLPIIFVSFCSRLAPSNKYLVACVSVLLIVSICGVVIYNRFTGSSLPIEISFKKAVLYLFGVTAVYYHERFLFKKENETVVDRFKSETGERLYKN